MPEQTQKQHTGTTPEQDADTDGLAAAKAARTRAAAVSADTADLLDDIDDLLNEQPLDLVENFIQESGQ